LDRAAHETRQAMDLMQREFGIERFVLFGLCSGADDSFHTALTDSRVCGALLMDGCGYRTNRYYIHRLAGYYPRRLASAGKWRAFLSKQKAAWDGSSTLRSGNDIREFPGRDHAAVDLQRLIDRGVLLRFLYTGGAEGYYNYASQFEDMFFDVQFRDRVSWRLYSQMDHVAFLCEDRAALVSDMVGWVRDSFDGPRR
jgi:hypothetical protein